MANGYFKYVTSIDGIRIESYLGGSDMKLRRALVSGENVMPIIGAAVVEQIEVEATACRDAVLEIEACNGMDGVIPLGRQYVPSMGVYS